MLKNLLRNENGDTNIISLIILLGVIVVAAIIFKPYIVKLFSWILGLFG